MTPFNISRFFSFIKHKWIKSSKAYPCILFTPAQYIRSPPQAKICAKKLQIFLVLNVTQAYKGIPLCDDLCTFKVDSYFLHPFSLTEGSDRYYPPQEEETNEIERQQSQVRDTHVQTRADDSNRNEVISTQQMCKSSALFTKMLKFM